MFWNKVNKRYFFVFHFYNLNLFVIKKWGIMEKHELNFWKRKVKDMNDKENVRIVCEMKSDILGNAACYRLISIDLFGREVYAVSVSFLEENGEVLLGDNEENAMRFFVAVCRNSVTPCTFLEVFFDFCAKIQ